VGKSIKASTETLTSGKQTDLTDCGLCAANIIAHAVLQDPVWKQETNYIHRAERFMEVSDHLASRTETERKGNGKG
jgi:hypothetical protein